MWGEEELTISGNGPYVAFTMVDPLVALIDDIAVYRVENPFWEPAP